MALDFTKNDERALKGRGISPAQAAAQVDRLRQGVPWIRLQAPATDGAGIRILSEKQFAELILLFEGAQGEGRVMKFVPASGAASRMFHALRLYLQSAAEPAPPDKFVEEFFQNLDRFAFAQILWERCRKRGVDRKSLTTPEGRKLILKELLGAESLNYENLPKGLIPFHTYPDHVRTGFEEHLVEVLQYVRDHQGLGRLHFTLSREHGKRVREFFNQHLGRYETQETEFLLSFSEQKSSTDTLALDSENNPFRLEDGSLLFRPGGHGALLENLNECDGDVVFIKNIDNVTHDRLKPVALRYKKALGGLLVQVQTKVLAYLQEMESSSVPPQRLGEIGRFVQEELGFRQTSAFSQKSLKEILHRPLRVCGMVPNQGEPGGAPFWVQGEGGVSTLQIVESAQVDQDDFHQAEIFRSATHFNPVDLVCGLRDHRGSPFDLMAFRDDRAVFISKKTHGGRRLKALEWPGLWNGGMAHWNTVFVEVPLETFAPVKVVNDLLRPEHQP